MPAMTAECRSRSASSGDLPERRPGFVTTVPSRGRHCLGNSSAGPITTTHVLSQVTIDGNPDAVFVATTSPVESTISHETSPPDSSVICADM